MTDERFWLEPLEEKRRHQDADRAAALGEENDRLRSALAPFAAWYRHLTSTPILWPENLPLFVSHKVFPGHEGHPTVGDLRTAAELLSEPIALKRKAS